MATARNGRHPFLAVAMPCQRSPGHVIALWLLTRIGRLAVRRAQSRPELHGPRVVGPGRRRCIVRVSWLSVVPIVVAWVRLAVVLVRALGGLRRERQGNAERGALTWRRTNPGGTAVSRDESRDDRQAKAGAARRPGRVRPVEPLEDMLGLFLRQARPLVGHFEHRGRLVGGGGRFAVVWFGLRAGQRLVQGPGSDQHVNGRPSRG